MSRRFSALKGLPHSLTVGSSFCQLIMNGWMDTGSRSEHYLRFLTNHAKGEPVGPGRFNQNIAQPFQLYDIIAFGRIS